jgi:plastocyanin
VLWGSANGALSSLAIMNSHLHRIGLVAASIAASMFLLACGNETPQPSSPEKVAENQPDSASSANSPSSSSRSKKRMDPREDGFEIGLGEWALTAEAKSIRPGEVTMLITNRGTMDHGFEIEIDDDHSGSGGGDGFKFETELLSPGESTRFKLDLPPGIYKIECLVDGHDDLGMEAFLRVDPNARLVAQEDGSRGDSEVAISDFAFSPETIRVAQGTEVTWSNDDPTEHTVTALDSSFDSGVLAGGETFSERLTDPGTYRYRCAIHPEMTARVEVLR